VSRKIFQKKLSGGIFRGGVEKVLNQNSLPIAALAHGKSQGVFMARFVKKPLAALLPFPQPFL
jgi:hypothetical protein